VQIPASNLFASGFHRFVGNRECEVDEVLPLPILRSPRPKRVAEKIELLVWVRPSPVIILAVDNLRLLRMKLQPTVSQASGYGRPNLLGLLLRSAMHDGIIGETLKRHLPILRRHPPIKRIVQKQIGQQRADDAVAHDPVSAKVKIERDENRALVTAALGETGGTVAAQHRRGAAGAGIGN
jgi:hypothetical protein